MKTGFVSSIAAVVVVLAGCGGSGTAGSTGIDVGSGTPGSSSEIPPSGGTTPGSSDTPASGGSIPGGGGSGTAAACATVCQLLVDFPCITQDFGGATCLAACQQSVAGDPAAARCAGPSAALLKCAADHAAMHCDDQGKLQLEKSVASACATEYATYSKECTNANGSCTTGGDCSGCQGACEQCTCQTGTASACSNACAPTGGDCAAPTCLNCADPCSTCLCGTHGDQTACASLCGG